MGGVGEAKLVLPFFSTYVKNGRRWGNERKEDRETWDWIIWSLKLQLSSRTLFRVQIKTAGLT